jgi:hypothetical protein
VALAAAAPDAPAVPVIPTCKAALVVALVAVLGSRTGAQRGVLPFGLKAGHHSVDVRQAATDGVTSWLPRDSGRFPVVIISGNHSAALDSVLPVYLASHGFRVARARGGSAEAVARLFGDSTPVAVVEWGRDTAATAILESATPLSIRLVRPGDSRHGRFRVTLPPLGKRPGAEERRYRLLCAVTQAILNATLVAARPTLPELAARLRAAGLQGAYIRVS